MRLAEFSRISAGHPFRGVIPEVPGTRCRAVQMKNVSQAQGIDWASVVETEVSGRRVDWLHNGDILFAARGSRNYAVLVEQCPSHTVAAPHFFVIRIQGASVLPEYLVWFLNQAPSVRYFQREAEGSRTLSIRRGVLEKTPIAIPPPAKQRAIIGLANTLRQEQRIAQQLIENAEQMHNTIAMNLMNDMKD